MDVTRALGHPHACLDARYDLCSNEQAIDTSNFHIDTHTSVDQYVSNIITVKGKRLNIFKNIHEIPG